MSETFINVEKKSVERLKKKIVLLESTNLNSRQLTEPQMIKKIQDMIEEEVRCCSNQ